MPEALLTILKLCFLALLYLFLARVVRVVVLEMRGARVATTTGAATAPPQGKGRPARKERGALQLRIVEPAARAGETFPLADEVTVGRAAGCGVVLPDDTFVSQVHARVFRRNTDVFVEDLGSTNGTFVDGERIGTATRLRKGDRVQFGGTVAEVVR